MQKSYIGSEDLSTRRDHGQLESLVRETRLKCRANVIVPATPSVPSPWPADAIAIARPSTPTRIRPPSRTPAGPPAPDPVITGAGPRRSCGRLCGRLRLVRARAAGEPGTRRLAGPRPPGKHAAISVQDHRSR